MEVGASLASRGRVAPLQPYQSHQSKQLVCSRAWKHRRSASQCCEPSRRGLSVVALRNYSGHDTPVSSPVVNEKGIVVSCAHLYWSVKLSCKMLSCLPAFQRHVGVSQELV